VPWELREGPFYNGFFVGHLSAIRVVDGTAVIGAREKADFQVGGDPSSVPS